VREPGAAPRGGTDCRLRRLEIDAATSFTALQAVIWVSLASFQSCSRFSDSIFGRTGGLTGSWAPDQHIQTAQWVNNPEVTPTVAMLLSMEG
jgi:hypothetical protein